ncbi:hypothetical protein LTR66_004004 [Elasticomyces elasticus]|nr:hypothetical protein LTR66_004004 [Elasticomyces elasticus]
MTDGVMDSMPPSPTRTRSHTLKTWGSDSSGSSSRSAELYHLDEADEKPILLYEYRGGLRTSSQKDLCSTLDRDHTRRVTTKPLPRFQSYVEVQRRDLYLGNEHDLYADFPNYNSSLASIQIPRQIYWNHGLFNSYPELYIISRETSPSSSTAESQESSRRLSPSSTWDSQASAGAVEGKSETAAL